jgi:hypothetical protein
MSEERGEYGGAPIGPEPASIPKEDEKPQYAMRVDTSQRPFMKIEVNCEQVGLSNNSLWQFIGFMEHCKSLGEQLAVNLARERAEMSVRLNRLKNGEVKRNFLDKIMRRP